jgi:glucan 1,3-beta-glucosidase
MSYRKEKFLSLAGGDLNKLNIEELKTLARKILKNSVHGICFSPYDENQRPGDKLDSQNVKEKLDFIKPHFSWCRSFSCTEDNDLIPALAKESGFSTLVGAWLSDDYEKNEQEINRLIELCNEGLIDIAAVGNESLYRKELTEEELIDYIERVKAMVKVPVGYVDAYYEFTNRPKLADACEIILANCYPFWEGCQAEYSLLYMKEMYNQAVKAGNGKPVIITETGWPSAGTNLDAAQPSYENYLRYFIAAQLWSLEEKIEMFYFSSFDEPWKVGDEGDVGAFWGIWDKEQNLKV